MNDELKLQIQQAIHEIRNLRRTNEVLAAKVEVMELFACVLPTQPASRHEGASIDIAWELQRSIDEAEKGSK